LPPGKGGRNFKGWQHDQPPDWTSRVLSAGLEARLYGRQGCPPLHQAMLPRLLGFGLSDSTGKRKESRVPDNNCPQVRNICRTGTSKRISLANFILSFISFIPR
jgi:hypothetical protein